MLPNDVMSETCLLMSYDSPTCAVRTNQGSGVLEPIVRVHPTEGTGLYKAWSQEIRPCSPAATSLAGTC